MGFWFFKTVVPRDITNMSLGSTQCHHLLRASLHIPHIELKVIPWAGPCTLCGHTMDELWVWKPIHTQTYFHLSMGYDLSPLHLIDCVRAGDKLTTHASKNYVSTVPPKE